MYLLSQCNENYVPPHISREQDTIVALQLSVCCWSRCIASLNSLALFSKQAAVVNVLL